jgi:gas vesicle protein
MSDRESSFGTFLMGFIAGGIAGAIATVLYAPKSGEETRRVLRDKKDDLIEKANVSMDEAYKQAEIVAKDARGMFDDFSSNTKSYAEEWSKKGRDHFEEGKEKIKGTINKAADAEDIEIPTN